MTNKRKQGISLIVLIITIVVIIILATAIIVNLAQTNIIGNANEAVVKQDIKTFQDELDLYIADQYATLHGKFDISTVNANTMEEVKAIIPSVENSKYQNDIAISNGKVIIKSTMQEPQRTWALEVLNEEKYVTATVDKIVEVSNATINGENPTYSNPVIPVGFKAVETTDATWTDTDSDGNPDGWNDGLVIQDERENEFVWVPVDGTNVTYTKKFDSYKKQVTLTGVVDDSNAIPVSNENEQIIKYGGFYVGRYEAGVPVDSEINGESAETSDTTGMPVVQKDATVWTFISYPNAVANSMSFINTKNVKSGLITGTGWDTLCTWIHSEKDSDGNAIHDVTDSILWGNYCNTDGAAKYDTDGTIQISGNKQTAGYSEYWKAKNIYDLAGNAYEFSAELNASNTDKSINRGSRYINDGTKTPASYRYGGNELSKSTDTLGFRIVLYIM